MYCRLSVHLCHSSKLMCCLFCPLSEDHGKKWLIYYGAHFTIGAIIKTAPIKISDRFGVNWSSEGDSKSSQINGNFWRLRIFLCKKLRTTWLEWEYCMNRCFYFETSLGKQKLKLKVETGFKIVKLTPRPLHPHKYFFQVDLQKSSAAAPLI